MVQLKENSSVAEFYAGKSVFVTGGTGFLGKVFIEKLLYSCKDIDTIYILIRQNKTEDPIKRMSEMTESVLFDRIRKERPKDVKKLCPIIGDVSKPKLGLSELDRSLLIKKVSVVFHVAASVRFNQKLSLALAINVEGTCEVIKLCQQMEQLDALVHVSTAYSNTDKPVIDEIVYPPPAPLNEVYEFIERNGDDEEVIKELLNQRPNTYTYSKSLAEYIISKNCIGIPTAIVRPSIVTSIAKEPVEGWLDNWNGPSGYLWATAKGTNRFMRGCKKYIADLIPVDLVTNLCIVAATQCKKQKELKVYNCCSSPRNPISYGSLWDNFLRSAEKRGQLSDVVFPHVFFIYSSLLVTILQLIFQKIPGYIIDQCLILFGRPPKYGKQLTTIAKLQSALDFFTTHEWEFRDGNVRELLLSLSEEDKRTFYFDTTDIEWISYIDKYCEGMIKYLVK